MKKSEGLIKFFQELERRLSGKEPGRSFRGKPRADDRELLALATELAAARPEPRPEFLSRMDERIAALTGTEIDHLGDVAESGADDTGRPRGPWAVPAWLTLPRAAAVVAALVIGLGAIGLTRAIIGGGFPGGFQQAQQTSSVSAPTPATGDGSVAGSSSATDLKSAAQDSSGAYRSESENITGSAGAPVAGAGIAGSIADLPSTQRIIQTAAYDIEVPEGDFQANYDRISALAAKFGGYVVSAETRKSGEEQPFTGSVSIRVSTAEDGFSRALSELDGIGTVLSREISGQDITEEYVDLQSRLRNADAQEAQLLALMQKAQTIDEILVVQSRLADIQSQIEQIKGRIKYMESRTDFATISVSLRESGATVTPTDSSATRWGFVDALECAGWLAVQSVNFVIMSLGVIIPVALMGVLAFAGGRWLVRRRGRGK